VSRQRGSPDSPPSASCVPGIGAGRLRVSVSTVARFANGASNGSEAPSGLALKASVLRWRAACAAGSYAVKITRGGRTTSDTTIVRQLKLPAGGGRAKVTVVALAASGEVLGSIDAGRGIASTHVSPPTDLSTRLTDRRCLWLPRRGALSEAFSRVASRKTPEAGRPRANGCERSPNLKENPVRVEGLK
jgi:hypothetical protein